MAEEESESEQDLNDRIVEMRKYKEEQEDSKRETQIKFMAKISTVKSEKSTADLVKYL